MNNLFVKGHYSLSPSGINKFDLFNAVKNESRPNIEIEDLVKASTKSEILRIPQLKVDWPIPPSVLRRMGRLTTMLFYSTLKVLEDAKISPKNLRDTGIIISSSNGPISRADQYMQKLIKFGEKGASPIHFSTSIHNASTSFISQTLEMIGPISTITNQEHTLSGSIELASSWLEAGVVKRVILISGDEYSHFDAYDFIDRKIMSSYDNYNPMDNNTAIPGEAMVGMILEKNEQNAKAIINAESGINISKLDNATGIIDAKGGYSDIKYNKWNLKSYGKVTGSTPSQSCADLAFALETIEKKNEQNINLYQVSSNDCTSEIKISSC